MNTTDVAALIANPKALFVINHSGGKDSQAMMIKLLQLGIPVSRMIAIHADLHEVEWQGTLAHAQAQCDAAGVTFIVARAVTGRGKAAKDKSFFDMVRERKAANQAAGKVAPAWPTKGCRECTSALKRDPINKQAVRYANANGFSIIVSCEGLRAEESKDRAEALPFKRETRLDMKDRPEVRMGYKWLPIHDMTTDQVFATIAQAGQQPHPAYALGNTRLSCVFCFQASKADLVNGAKHNPALAQTMIDFEREIGGEFHITRKTLDQLIGEAMAEAEAFALVA